MIVLKSTYDKLFKLFVLEKHGALELHKENLVLQNRIRILENKIKALS